jgi:hypothetical protein
VLDIAARSGLYAGENGVLLNALPLQTAFETDLEDLGDNPSSLLAEVDPLVQPTEQDPTSTALLTYDSQGLSKYVRLGVALTTILSQNRQIAKEQLWSFRYLLLLQQLCLDLVAAPSWPSDAFKPGTLNEAKTILDNVTQLIIYLGNSLFDELGLNWHKQLIERLQRPTSETADPHDAQDIMFHVYSNASQNPSRLRGVRLLRRVMQMALRDVEPGTLDLWAGFAQSIQTQCACT